MQEFIHLIKTGEYPDEHFDLTSVQSAEFMVSWMTENPERAVEALINTTSDTLFDAMEFELRKSLEDSYSDLVSQSRIDD